MNNSFPLNELSIYDVFNSSQVVNYEIPIYQRNYAWGKDEIAELVNDVWDACKKGKEAYYIGTLVTYDKGDNTFEVIDGQQRLTTLYLLLKSLNVKTDNKLTYRARTRSIKALERIDKKDDLSFNELDKGIINGYCHIGHVLADKSEKFKNYLLYKVRIIHYNVPRNVDLNHYFEVMNSRGEQLEKHEIVKAKLMNELDENDRSKFAAIWDACSEMNTYVQTKVGVKTYFGHNLKDFVYYDSSFDDLPGVDASGTRLTTLSNLIRTAELQANKKDADSDDSRNGMFQPIIDFPNFLLIVLKITRMGDAGFNVNNFILDDKELIDEFDKVIGNKYARAEDKQAFIKLFCFNLLKAKYLLDNYVVHQIDGDESTDDNPWKLQRWQIERHGYAKNLVDDEQVDKNNMQNTLVQLLSMFEVSFTARQRKNYLFYVLSHLFENRNLETYCKFLEDLAKKYFFDIYMKQEGLNKINVPMPGEFDKAIIKDNHIDVQISNSNADYSSFCRIYGNGSEMSKGIPLFVFNYMDYCLWAKYANNLAGKELKKDDVERKRFFEEIGCQDFELNVFKQFYFSRTRRSLEHYYPQANINYGITEEQINCFGNFAMIGSDANSSGSNWSPHTKLEHYLDSSNKFRQVSVASLKFRIMMQVCDDNYGKRSKDQEWMFEDIQNHQILMLNILLGQ